MKKIKCGNEKCKKSFKPGKWWAKYCSRSCGDAVRQRRYYDCKTGVAFKA